MVELDSTGLVGTAYQHASLTTLPILGGSYQNIKHTRCEDFGDLLEFQF